MNKLKTLTIEKEQLKQENLDLERKLESPINLERAYQTLSVFGTFHSGHSPKLTAGWQLALLAGVSHEIALKGIKADAEDEEKRNMAHYAAWSGNSAALQ